MNFNNPWLLAGLLLAFTSVTPAQSLTKTINWVDETGVYSNDCCGPTTSGGDFDQGEITFTGFTTDSLDSITGTGIFHSHGGVLGTTVTLSLLLDNVWTNVSTATIVANDSTDYLISTLITSPVSFATAVITGISLTSVPGIGNTYHDVKISFDFNEVSAIPIPAALPLFGTGLALMGFVGWRRKRKIA